MVNGNLQGHHNIEETGVRNGCAIATAARFRWSLLGPEELTQAFTNMEANMQAMHTALVNEQTKIADFEEEQLKNTGGGGSGTAGLVGAIRKGCGAMSNNQSLSGVGCIPTIG